MRSVVGGAVGRVRAEVGGEGVDVRAADHVVGALGQHGEAVAAVDEERHGVASGAGAAWGSSSGRTAG
jgi:hypothetical protein